MRFKRSQLLKNVSKKQLLEYQKENGFRLVDFSHEEITLTEMVSKLYGFYRYSGNMMLLKHLEPTAYLNQVDMRKRIALDISRCLVTAKKLGEDVSRCAPPENLFDFMIQDLSLHARCLSERAITANFGSAYHEAALTLYSEVCTLIRRLKVTRQEYDSIKTLPGAVLCDSPKTVSSDTASSETVSVKPAEETEHCVRPERAIAPMPTAVIPESESKSSEPHEFNFEESLKKMYETLRERGIDVNAAANDTDDDEYDEIWEEEFIEPDERVQSDLIWQNPNKGRDPERLNACFDRFSISNECRIKKRI